MTNAEFIKHRDDEFIRYLKEDCAYPRVEEIGDGRWVAIAPLMFHWTMMVGKIGDRYGYENKYCYENEAKAIVGLFEWMGRNYDGEPTGWHRNPETGRRRENGDPTKETIAW